jgi:hypothetical protein
MIAAAVNQGIESDPLYIEQAKADIAEARVEVGMLRKRGLRATVKTTVGEGRGSATFRPMAISQDR